MTQGSRFPELPEDIPPGRFVSTTEAPEVPPEIAGRALLWMSDAPVEDPAPTWSRLRRAASPSRLYPLLLGDRTGRALSDVWLFPEGTAAIDAWSADAALRSLWAGIVEEQDQDQDEDEWGEGEEPTEDQWPTGDWRGLAEPSNEVVDRWDMADQLAAHLQRGSSSPGFERTWRIGLVPAERGADALTLAGWSGPCNHTNDTELISAVVRSWEDRFGACVVGVDSDTLHLSVAAPPRDLDHATAIAYEHYAFCPDNVWQSQSGSFSTYAEGLVDSNYWFFWWD